MPFSLDSQILVDCIIITTCFTISFIAKFFFSYKLLRTHLPSNNMGFIKACIFICTLRWTDGVKNTLICWSKDFTPLKERLNLRSLNVEMATQYCAGIRRELATCCKKLIWSAYFAGLHADSHYGLETSALLLQTSVHAHSKQSHLFSNKPRKFLLILSS